MIEQFSLRRGLSRILCSCGDDGVRVWDLHGGHQVLHVDQPNANCVFFASSGEAIAAGFADGCVRYYTPRTGSVIHNIVGVRIFTCNIHS